MIDLSIHTAADDEQTERCAKLLVAVIVKAVTDACTFITKEESDASRNLDLVAAKAVHFLFADGTPFEEYARMLNIPHKDMRSALLSMRPATSSVYSLSERQLRSLHTRKRWLDETPLTEEELASEYPGGEL
jgi:hypothetical protein